MIEIRVATQKDAEEMVSVMRDVHRREAVAFGHLDECAAITHAMEQSRMAWTARDGGELVCMWGIVPAADDTGVPWVCTAPLFERRRKWWVEVTREYMGCLFPMMFSTIRGAIGAEHTGYLRWLSALGYAIKERRLIGHDLYPIVIFERAS